MKLGIVGIDRPCEELIVRAYEDGENLRCKYISAKHRKHPEMVFPKDQVTDLEEFGVRILFNAEVYKVEKVGESTATYRDGTTRNWQGDNIEVGYV